MMGKNKKKEKEKSPPKKEGTLTREQFFKALEKVSEPIPKPPEKEKS
jgi:hypothetical protein